MIKKRYYHDKVCLLKLPKFIDERGGEIESLDDGTLFSAFKNRSNLNSNSD